MDSISPQANSDESGTTSNTYTPKITDSQMNAFEKGIAQGWIKVDVSKRALYISPTLWNSIDVQAKEGLGRIGAVRIAKELNIDLYWCDLYDMNTGKKIATYSESWGFKMY